MLFFFKVHNPVDISLQLVISFLSLFTKSIKTIYMVCLIVIPVTLSTYREVNFSPVAKHILH